MPAACQALSHPHFYSLLLKTENSGRWRKIVLCPIRGHLLSSAPGCSQTLLALVRCYCWFFLFLKPAVMLSIDDWILKAGPSIHRLYSAEKVFLWRLERFGALKSAVQNQARADRSTSFPVQPREWCINFWPFSSQCLLAGSFKCSKSKRKGSPRFVFGAHKNLYKICESAPWQFSYFGVELWYFRGNFVSLIQFVSMRS